MIILPNKEREKDISLCPPQHHTVLDNQRVMDQAELGCSASSFTSHTHILPRSKIFVTALTRLIYTWSGMTELLNAFKDLHLHVPINRKLTKANKLLYIFLLSLKGKTDPIKWKFYFSKTLSNWLI